MKTYADCLKRAMDEEAKASDYAKLSDEQLQQMIDGLTAGLKQPMPNHERIIQCAWRKGARAELERRAASK